MHDLGTLSLGVLLLIFLVEFSEVVLVLLLGLQVVVSFAENIALADEAVLDLDLEEGRVHFLELVEANLDLALEIFLRLDLFEFILDVSVDVLLQFFLFLLVRELLDVVVEFHLSEKLPLVFILEYCFDYILVSWLSYDRLVIPVVLEAILLIFLGVPITTVEGILERAVGFRVVSSREVILISCWVSSLIEFNAVGDGSIF